MIKGNLSEFSLGELFQVIEAGKKTGMLSLTSNIINQYSKNKKHYIWFSRGEIIAAANCLDGKGLLSLIKRRSWINENNHEIIHSKYSLKMPLGNYLKIKGILKDSDLQLIFRIQIMREITPLFQIKKADYKFQENNYLPLSEMTGLSMGGRELVLKGLRGLRDWDILKEKLPQPTSGLTKNEDQKLDVTLDLHESKVWQLSQPNLSLADIAKKCALQLEKVQQSAFRLMMIGLAEELPFVTTISNKQEDLAFSGVSENRQNCPSSSFMNDLMSFLQEGSQR